MASLEAALLQNGWAPRFSCNFYRQSGKFFPKQGGCEHLACFKISPLSIEYLMTFGRMRRGMVNALLGESGSGGLGVETVY
jgi:hypothetical protein